MNNQTNFSLVERVRGHGPAIGQDELIDLLAELDAWRGAAYDRAGIYGPEDLEPAFTELEANQANPDHADYDHLKEFFDDCVEALEDGNGRWPCAEPWDNGLRLQVIDAIRKGAQ